MKNIITYSSIALALLLSACGSSSDEAQTDLIKGQLVDSYVQNADYHCADGKNGVTDRNGTFSCGELPVNFNIGGLELGSIEELPEDGHVFPQDLVGVDRSDLNNTDVVAIARLLQTLDDDKNPDNGIYVPDEQKKKFKEKTHFEANDLDVYTTTITTGNDHTGNGHTGGTVTGDANITGETGTGNGHTGGTVTGDANITGETGTGNGHTGGTVTGDANITGETGTGNGHTGGTVTGDANITGETGTGNGHTGGTVTGDANITGETGTGDANTGNTGNGHTGGTVTTDDTNTDTTDTGDTTTDTVVDEDTATDHLTQTTEFVDAVDAADIPKSIKDALLTPANELTQDAKNTLAYMGNEERLAYDVYKALYDYQLDKGVKVNQLNNIANNSEKKHITTMQLFVKKYAKTLDEFTNLDATANLDADMSYSDLTTDDLPAGKYNIQAIQDLYDALIAKGQESKQAALEVGCMVEVTDINDLDEKLAIAKESDASDLVTGFEFLRDGSYTHYWSFDKGLKNMDVSDGCCVLGELYCHPEYPQK